MWRRATGDRWRALSAVERCGGLAEGNVPLLGLVVLVLVLGVMGVLGEG